MLRLTPRLLLAFLLISASAHAERLVDPLFADDSVLDVRIVAPFDSIMDDRPIERYVSGTFHFVDADGSEVAFDVGLRTRGRFRRNEDICPFAPIRLNFRKSQTKDTLFDKQDKVKLVTHCRTNSKAYEQNVLSEYLAYRTMNVLTDISFHARLLRITYVDTDRGDREYERYAFLIESSKRFAKRIGAPRVSARIVAIPDLVPEYAALAAMFQYFLGNTDYSMIASAKGENCCHNHELFGTRQTRYFSVPYDFDMTGFVDADHAEPNPRFGLRSVRDRLYRGRCAHNDHVPDVVALFQEKRAEIYALINEDPLLRNSTRRSHLQFVDGFFEDIETPSDVRKNILDACL